MRSIILSCTCFVDVQQEMIFIEKKGYNNAEISIDANFYGEKKNCMKTYKIISLMVMKIVKIQKIVDKLPFKLLIFLQLFRLT